MAQIIIKGIVFGMKKINETTYKAVISDSDLMPYTGADGKFYHNTFADMKTQLGGVVSGFQGALAIADVPANDGYYMATETGVYVNAGNIIVNLAQGMNIIVKTGSSFTKIIIPIDMNGYVRKDEIVDNLNSNIGNVPLSAKQGNVLAQKTITDWAAGTLYKIGKIVLHDGRIWNLNADTTTANYNIPPGQTAIWDIAVIDFGTGNLFFDDDRSHNANFHELEIRNISNYKLEYGTKTETLRPGSPIKRLVIPNNPQLATILLDVDFDRIINSAMVPTEIYQHVQPYSGDQEIMQLAPPTSPNGTVDFGTQKYGFIKGLGTYLEDDTFEVVYAVPFENGSVPAITMVGFPGAGLFEKVIINVHSRGGGDTTLKTGFIVKFYNIDNPSAGVTDPWFYYLINGH